MHLDAIPSSAIKAYLHKNAESLRDLSEQKQYAFLRVLEESGNMHQHDALYPDIITKLTTTKVKDILCLPQNAFQEKEIQNLISLYLVNTQFALSKKVDAYMLERLAQAYPTLQLTDALLLFSSQKTHPNGNKTTIPLVELGWYHMPSEYHRLNIYSGLSKSQSINEQNPSDLEYFTASLAHLYGEALNTHKPLFGKFTTTHSEVRLCSYVNDELLRWQLKNLAEYFEEPLHITGIEKEGDLLEFRIFSQGKVGVRISHESFRDKASQKLEILKIKKLIESLE